MEPQNWLLRAVVNQCMGLLYTCYQSKQPFLVTYLILLACHLLQSSIFIFFFKFQNVVTNIHPAKIKGIGFDATCSLVVLDKNCNPISISDAFFLVKDIPNIIMWMDHRAQAEADLINKTNHDILKYVGGKVSLEMEMPKLLWLKKNFSDKWSEFGYFFDLPDFLTWKATGSMSRSLCSLVCKWNYECSVDGKQGWNVSFLREIGLEDLAQDDFIKIGNKVLMPGEKCGGLLEDVAKELGLLPGTPVATSIIDAHAGGLGMIGTNGEGIDKDMTSRLSLICGTSTCHMAVNRNAVNVEGIWGPYFSAMVPNLWLNEAGQSASGMLLDYIISSHPAGMELLRKHSAGEYVFAFYKYLFMYDIDILSDYVYLYRFFFSFPVSAVT